MTKTAPAAEPISAAPEKTASPETAPEEAAPGEMAPGEMAPAAGLEAAAEQAPEPPPEAAGAAARDRLSPHGVLGQIAWLMMLSPQHRHFFLADLEWLVGPAVMLRQFKLFSHKNTPVAYVSWAFLSEEAEAHLKAHRRLRPGDWRSGDKRVVVDVVAPFGGAEKFAAKAAEQ